MTMPRDPSELAWSRTLPGTGTTLELDGRPLVMGVINITPDSFSDGGRFLEVERAVEHGLLLAEEGADVLDLGAESTRPGGGVYGEGSQEVSVRDELDRLLPVLEALRVKLPEMPLSIDTRKGGVAKATLEAGADLINDVGGLQDPTLVAAVAAAGCPVIAMHSRGEISTMQRGISFEDVVGEVRSELAECLARAAEGGVTKGQVILDPGIGFGKTARQNLTLIRHLDELATLGCPLLLGASRKSFIARVDESPPDRRLGGSLAAVAWAAQARLALVRVHDVAETVQFLKVWNAIDSAVD